MIASKRWLTSLLLVGGAVALTVLGGCCTLGLRTCAPTDQLAFVGDTKMNSCSGDDYGYPVGVRLYYLSDKVAFESAELRDLWDDKDEDLDGSLLGTVTELTIVPDSAVVPWSGQRPAGATWLGIAANFCRLDADGWRQVVPLDDALRLRVMLKDVQLIVTTER
ncbi:MAG: type VI secretion system lipoprotein TssJ [bacterium]|nr:type VI secretion system lipoprotein TssJ [bacterium]